MKYLHKELEVGPQEVVEVSLDGHANVMLMDAPNFDRYRKGETYRYYGGLAKRSPAQLHAPHLGRWNVVVDLGGFAGHVRAGIRVLESVGAAGRV